MAYLFCPACGDKLPQEVIVKFCPHCGVGLGSQLSSPTSLMDQWDTAAVATMADVVACCDRFAAEQSGCGLPAEEVRNQAAELFRRLKAKLPPRAERTRSSLNRMRPVGRQSIAEGDSRLSVVLKACTDKERLAGRLSRVLQRGMLATRMAVDMAPCVILYKSKPDDARTAIAIFEDEGSAYAVVTGDFEANAPLNRLIEGYDSLDPDAQTLLSAAPPALWLGEDIRAIIPDVELEHELGLLIISGGNLCFLSRPVRGSRAQWLVIPYSRIAEVIDHPDPSGGMLEVVYRQFGREDLFRFSDEETFCHAYEEIRRVMEERQ